VDAFGALVLRTLSWRSAITLSSEQVPDVDRQLPAAGRQAFVDSDDSYLRSIIQCEHFPNFYGAVALKGLENLAVSFGSQPAWVASSAAVVNSYLNHAATLHRRPPAPKASSGVAVTCGDEERRRLRPPWRCPWLSVGDRS
jgi:hypothetical protein